MVFFFQHQVDKVVFEKGPKDAEACRVALGQLRPSLRWVGFRVLAFGGNRRCLCSGNDHYLSTYVAIDLSL